MDPYPYLKAFAWIAIVALACSVFSTHWIPIMIGAVLTAALLKFALPSR